MIFSNSNIRHLPAILIVQDSQEKLTLNSLGINSFQQTCISVTESVTKNTDIFSWIQQNQPDLIILNLEWSKISELNLTTTLRLDWLTRNIPILAIANRKSDRFWITNLDCDAYLFKPYSKLELETAIVSLVSNFAGFSYAS